MKLRSLAALGLLMCLLAWAQALAQNPPQPAAASASSPAGAYKPGPTINGIRDTGQYLPDTAVIGRVDGRLFRVLEFRERWFASYFLDRPKTDSAGRCEFLQSMVNKEVLAALAREVNRPLTFEDRAVLRDTRQRLLSNVTFARLVSDSTRFTTEEVRNLYGLGNFRYHVQRIVTDAPATAERARADVAGRRLSWAQAVKAYSNPRDDQGPDGDIGWIPRTDFELNNAKAVFTLPDGALSPVFHDRDGWQFVRIVERRAEKQPAFTDIAKVLAREIMSVKLGERTEKVRDMVRRRIGMVYDSTNIAWAAALFAETERQSRGTPDAPVIDMAGNVPEFQPADTSRLLARWKDGTFTLGGFLSAYDAIPPMTRDRVGSFGAFRSQLDNFALEPHMADLALERGLDRDSIVVSGLARKEEQIRVEHLFADSVEAKLWVSSEDRHAYYEAHLPDFFGLQSVTYAAILRHSKGGADSLAARLQAGESAAAILAADSLAGFASGSIKTMGERDENDLHKLIFEEMREGGLHTLGPDPGGNYAVIQKLVHDPGHQLPFEQVENVVDESVQNLKADRLLREFIGRHVAKHDVELHPERLMRIRLLDPTLSP
jgi:hypothetical protein